MEQTNTTQKFVIKSDGTIHVEWINPDFSDVILELYPEDERKCIQEMNKDNPIGAKIWCG